MRHTRALALILCLMSTRMAAQRGGGRGGRGGVQVMTLTSTAFATGATIPVKYTQPGHDVSPPLEWSAPDSLTKSFVLLVHDPNAPAGTSGDDVLHWLVWNIPASARSLPEGVKHGPEQADGMRQISVSGPYYRGPAAPSTGPVHAYVFELFALDTTVSVAAVGAPPAATRTAVLAAMTGHVRGKAALVGVFRRAAP